jgi:hypothetical protein
MLKYLFLGKRLLQFLSEVSIYVHFKFTEVNKAKTASVVQWLALKTKNTEVPGSIPRQQLRIFLRELGLERGPLSLVIG